ncbi:MAG: AEC family transporter [Geminicoccaceae bacterium]
MIAILSIIAPVFGLLAFGLAARFTPVFDRSAAQALNSFVYHFAIPVLLFRSLANSDLDASGGGVLLATFYSGTLAVFLLGMAAARLFFARRFDHVTILGFAATFGNSVLIGIPLVLNAFGDRGSFPLFLIISFHGLILFSVVTLLLEIGQGQGQGSQALFAKVFRGLITNPILMSLIVGVIYNRLGFGLAPIVDRWAELVAQAAVPCALFAAGATLKDFKVSENVAPALTIVFIKCLIHPLIVWSLGTFVFELRPLFLQVAVLIAAMPTGVNPYLFANRYKVGEAEAAAAISIGTPLSLLTVSLFLAFLGVTDGF